ncbi:hypothetical protein C8Q70DRAFT_650895 [Cubamyces menziesii]|nr:hypothetical protein C8Q70DRAFT_650895 [Cubamyces menziesii]
MVFSLSILPCTTPRPQKRCESGFGDWAEVGREGNRHEGEEVLVFLDKQLAEHGENLVIYVSFGPMFWPLMEENIPFLMARPSPFAHIPEDFVNKVKECSGAFVTKITWPIAADQEPNAAHLANNLDIAYELLEVRNGAGLGPIFRTFSCAHLRPMERQSVGDCWACERSYDRRGFRSRTKRMTRRASQGKRQSAL